MVFFIYNPSLCHLHVSIAFTYAKLAFACWSLCILMFICIAYVYNIKVSVFFVLEMSFPDFFLCGGKMTSPSCSFFCLSLFYKKCDCHSKHYEVTEVFHLWTDSCRKSEQQGHHSHQTQPHFYSRCYHAGNWISHNIPTCIPTP